MSVRLKEKALAYLQRSQNGIVLGLFTVYMVL